MLQHTLYRVSRNSKMGRILKKRSRIMRTRIKELRENKHMSQLKLAMNIGTTQQTISKIEAEQIVPRADILLGISKEFHVSTDYLIYASERKRTFEQEQFINKSFEKYYDLLLSYHELNEKNKIIIQAMINVLKDIEDV